MTGSFVNRNWLARLLLVTSVEGLLGWFPRGTHHPDKFIKPSEMRHHLEKRGFYVNLEDWTGLGPIGIDRRLDFTFGLLPINWLVYLRYAVVDDNFTPGRFA